MHLRLEEPIPTERDPIDVLTEGMSKDTALRVRKAIARAIRFGQLRDFYQDECKVLSEYIDTIAHSHEPGVPDSECQRCQEEDEEQRILGQAEHCLAQLGGRR